MKIHILNGPNLNLLGKREPQLYGNQTFASYLFQLQQKYQQVKLTYFQSNHEGSLIDELQSMGYGEVDGIIFNPAGYTHTSIALADTVAAIESPVVEVHLTDTESREAFRKQSYIRPFVEKTIQGFGLEGYALAIDFFVERNADLQKEDQKAVQ